MYVLKLFVLLAAVASCAGFVHNTLPAHVAGGQRVVARSSPQMFFGGAKKAAPVVTTSTVEVVNKKKTFEVTPPKNLRKELMDQKVEVYTLIGKLQSCGGGGQCGRCAVQVLDGMENLSPKSPVEKKVLAGKPENWRMSCCTRITKGSCKIKTQVN